MLQQFDDSNENDDDSLLQVEDQDRRDAIFQRRLQRGIHMDSGSTFPLYTLKQYLKNGSIRALNNKFEYGSNVGSRQLHEEGLSKFFPGWKMLDTYGKASVESLSATIQLGCDVIFDSRIWNGFIVHKDGKVWKFKEQDGLYTYMPGSSDPVLNEEIVVEQMLWRQTQRVHTLQDLYDIEGDEPSKYLLERERKLLEMIEHDLQYNPVEWVQDMVERARFGMNRLKQEAYVRGKVTQDNIERVLERIYGGVSKTYVGGVTRLFRHTDIDPSIMARTRYSHPYAADLPKPRDRNIDVMPFYNPIEPLEDLYERQQRVKKARLENRDKNNDSSTGYSAVQSVLANKEGFTKKQVELANRARSAYHMAGVGSNGFLE